MADMTEIEKASFKAPTEAHWYLPTGAPFHKVPYKDKKRKGELKDATLRDAREQGAARSVTSYQKFIAKPQLEVWSKNQLLDAIRKMSNNGWTWPQPGKFEEWLAEIVTEAQRAREEAAERGDKLHEALMLATKGKMIPEAFTAHVEAVRKALKRHKIDLSEGRAEVSFYSSEGYGGTVDWHRGSGHQIAEATFAPPVVIDYKSRELLDEKIKLAYPEKAQQLAAYRRAIQLPDADCYNVFVDMKANVCVHHWDEPTLRREEKKFLLLVKYVNINDKYWPTEPDRAVRLWERPL